MRYFICTSNRLPRFCTIEDSASGYLIVWTVFNFMEGSNRIATRTLHKNVVNGFIDSLATRAQKFIEVDETEFLLKLHWTRSRSEELARDGVPLETLFGE
jgi:hypothetical protein